MQRLMKIKGTTEKGEIIYERSGTIALNYQHGEAVQNVIEFNPRKNDTVEIRDIAGEDDTKASFTATFDNGIYTQLIIGFAQVHGRKTMDGTEKTMDKKANVQDILPLIYDVEDNRFENLSGWIIALYADRTATDELILSLIFKVVSAITETEINFKTVNAKENLIWVTLIMEDSEPQEIMFNLLSQGYKNVFAWVGHFVKRLAEANNYAGNFKERPAIVVIDEIDTYLHPLWQRNILNVLAKTFINTQFIVTTHSPLVANYLEEKSKAVYIIQDKGAVEKVQYIQGVNLKDAFYSWMQIPYRDAKTQNEINELFGLINSGDLDTAKASLKLLEGQVGNDGDLIRAKTELELSEKFDADFDDADFDFDN
ncbi:MAG: AAA family ATPase [Saprospiraceae bacterium]|nr:AAA family ATPase [Saprospiraceae bacterium]